MVTDNLSRPLTSGKFSDIQNIMKLASNSLSKEKYSLAADYCRKAVNAANESPSRDLIADAYYIWCMSCLKLERPREARKVCYEARLRLGNYIDLVYFELLIAAINEETDKIPKFVDNFLRMYDQNLCGPGAAGEKTRDNIGEVLILGGRANERLGNVPGAIEYYKRYISIFPEDKEVAKRIHQIYCPADPGQETGDNR